MVEQRHAVVDGPRERERRGSGEEMPGFGADDAAAVGCNFDQFVVGVGEVKEDRLWDTPFTAPADAGEDVACRELRVERMGFDDANSALNGARAGIDGV